MRRPFRFYVQIDQVIALIRTRWRLAVGNSRFRESREDRIQRVN